MHVSLHEGCLFLHGTATVHTVTASAYRQFAALCARSGVAAVDFGGLQQADSACVALLLAALRRCPAPLAVRGLPHGLRELVHLYELQDFAGAPPAAEPEKI